MKSLRLDAYLVRRGLVPTRSQAESYIKMGSVKVNGQVAAKAGQLVSDKEKVVLEASEKYVSRAGFKLASIAAKFRLDFRGKTVLDVGSSTGGFTDFALRRGAQKVIAIEAGKNQLHPSLQGDPRIELHEQTDILDVREWILENKDEKSNIYHLSSIPDIVLIDASFISLRKILPHVSGLIAPTTWVVAMVKPQFEAGTDLKHKGVIKNETIRRRILKDFEVWTAQRFKILDKADSAVSGEKGNRERFYLLSKLFDSGPDSK